MIYIIRIPLLTSDSFYSPLKNSLLSKPILQNRTPWAVACIASVLFVVIAAIYRCGFSGRGFSSNFIFRSRAHFPLPSENGLNTYPREFFIYLQSKFNPTYWRGNSSAICAEMFRFEEVMEKYSLDHAFIRTCFEEMDSFLTKQFFISDKALCLEREKLDWNIFLPFFTIAEKYFDVIEKQPELINNFKTKMANLPLSPDCDRLNFPKIALSQRNQLEILMTHFQLKQEKYLKHSIDLISKQQFNLNDVKKLIKLASYSTDQLMSDDKIDELQSAIVDQIPEVSSCWNKKDDMQRALNKGICGWSQQTQSTVIIKKLYRASKAWSFFKNQVNLSDEQIQIPRWYHATNYYNEIIDSGKVEVRHEKAFKGAWVSTQPELCFGDSVLAFNHRVNRLDEDKKQFVVFMNCEFGWWRGIQVDIPLVYQTKKISNLSCVALRKGTMKTEKLAIIQKLKNQTIDEPILLSIDQLNYMQKKIIKILGNPYFSDEWVRRIR